MLRAGVQRNPSRRLGCSAPLGPHYHPLWDRLCPTGSGSGSHGGDHWNRDDDVPVIALLGRLHLTKDEEEFVVLGRSQSQTQSN
jgi:hypothetical protein